MKITGEKSFYHQICDSDTITLLQPLLDSGAYVINPEDGKIWNKDELNNTRSLDANEWIYTNNPPSDYACTWWRDIAKVLRYVPSPCLSCWKVVVRPRNLSELYKAYMMQLKMVEENPECYCKCGMESRPFVFGSYGAYFYTKSLEAGRKRYNEVRRMVDAYVSSDVNVILKRYCSEFELDFGSTLTYKQPELAPIWEEMIRRDCQINWIHYVQPEMIIKKTMREWIKFAWDRGDVSVFQFTGMQHIVPPCFTYHDKTDEEIEELKNGK